MGSVEVLHKDLEACKDPLDWVGALAGLDSPLEVLVEKSPGFGADVHIGGQRLYPFHLGHQCNKGGHPGVACSAPYTAVSHLGTRVQHKQGHERALEGSRLACVGYKRLRVVVHRSAGQDVRPWDLGYGQYNLWKHQVQMSWVPARHNRDRAFGLSLIRCRERLPAVRKNGDYGECEYHNFSSSSSCMSRFPFQTPEICLLDPPIASIFISVLVGF